MEIRSLGYLIALDRCKGVPLAARELSMTPQGLSKAVRRLEEDLGCTLYTGPLGSSPLTEEGKCVLAHARLLTEEARAMRRELDAIIAHANNVVRLGVSVGIMGYLGEGVFDAFNNSSDCQVLVSEELPDNECDRRLVAGDYDYALLVNDPDPSLASIPVVNDYQFVWVNGADPLAGRPEVRLEDLDGRTLYMLNDDYRNTSLLLKLCSQAGVRPNVKFTCEMIRVYESACANQGMGLTCRNHAEATCGAGLTVALPLRALPWGFSLCWRREHVASAAESRFVDFVRSLQMTYE